MHPHHADRVVTRLLFCLCVFLFSSRLLLFFSQCHGNPVVCQHVRKHDRKRIAFIIVLKFCRREDVKQRLLQERLAGVAVVCDGKFHALWRYFFPTEFAFLPQDQVSNAYDTKQYLCFRSKAAEGAFSYKNCAIRHALDPFVHIFVNFQEDLFSRYALIRFIFSE